MAEFKHSHLAIMLALLLGSTTHAAAQHASHTSHARPAAQARLVDSAGKEAGRVTFMVMGDMLTGVVNASGLTPGVHAMHIHAVGKCEGPAFTSAGPHLNPDAKQHGLENPLGAHQGDLPELTAGADGKAHATFTARTTLPALFDADGAVFVVHAAADDNKTDPSGNSGARILCGVLEPGAK